MQDAKPPTKRSRDRTVSLDVHPQYRASMRSRGSTRSPKGAGPSDAGPSEILSPIPRRHPLHSSESLTWLQVGSSHSEADFQARCISPASVTSSVASTYPYSSSASKRLSFSVLQQPDLTARGSRTGSTRRGQETSRDDPGAGKRWVRWMHKQGMKAWVVPLAIATSAWVKWSIGLGDYSGHATPPMFGDYEAQRHWMELAIHLAPQQWYTYDLQYWGLDYPPLTAYISWLCGKVGSLIDPSWFAFEESRGIETYNSKLFMRSTVVALDILVYVPALYAFTRIWHRSRSLRTQHASLLILLFQPALLLVDFGHFQYNSVMLGLTLLALNSFAVGRDLLGAVCFVLSLAFKQMALYYAPVIGSYLLGKCIFLGPVQGTRLFIRVAVVTLSSFTLLFAPFLPPIAPLSTFFAAISRIFPFARGLFEDKVANFWCFTNVTLVKWKQLFLGKESRLIRLSAALTVAGFLPAVFGLLWGSFKTRLRTHPQVVSREGEAHAISFATPARTPSPTLPLLLYALLTTSMSFFLFSFQVHEKTILLPLLPLTLLLSGATVGDEVYSLGILGNVVGVFSMWPLLKRDGLGVQYIATLLLWCRLVGYNPFCLRLDSFVGLLSTAVNAAMILLHLLELIVTPPNRYPDLFPVLNVLVSTPVFGFIWLWSIKRGIEVGWALGGLPGSGTDRGFKDHDDGNPTEELLNLPTAGPVKSVRREHGARAVSLGHASGLTLASTSGYRDPRRRAVDRLRGSSAGIDE
ncbi:glycosyltransferase family 57 protein [Pisolithus tinctorius]|nr:glycosyltransferase family 57 protein [Pisolithus tinctorius]